MEIESEIRTINCIQYSRITLQFFFQKLEGWHHFLSESVGHRKHLAVEPSHVTMQPTSTTKHDMEQTVIGKESFTVSLILNMKTFQQTFW